MQDTPNTALVATDDLTTIPGYPDLRFDTPGQLEFGARCAAEILSIATTSVDSVSYQLVNGTRKSKNLLVSIQISDGEMGPVPYTTVSATLLHGSGTSWSLKGVTNSSGTVSLTLKNAPTGCFTTIVTDIGVLNWDPTTPLNDFCR